VSTETTKALVEQCAIHKGEIERLVRLLGRFRDYAADKAVWMGGSHLNPIWAEVADTLAEHDL